LADDENAVEQVLQAIERPQPYDAIYRLLTSLPNDVRIKDLEIDLESSSEVTLTAVVTAMDMDHLKEILTQLTRQIRHHFKSAQNFNLNDIDVRKGASNNINTTAPYLISLKLGLI
jgi:ribonucleotide reductase alpha subunit